jgi:uncharacterized protein (TIGR00297 family)
LTDFDVGAAAAAFVAYAAYRLGTLSLGGALAAVVVGAATYGALGVPGAAVLLAFFVSSIGLSRFGRARKRELLVDVGKTGPRDASQVLANGAVAALCAVLAVWVNTRYGYAFAGAFAAAAADTWGTEVGTLSRRAPVSILTLRRIPAGLSGGITLPGTLAEVAGALFVAGVALVIGRYALLPVALGGIAGAVVDSLLGGSLQSLRWCPQCSRATEREPHGCGANTTPLRGLGWIGNDAVNWAATLTGAAVAFALAR